MRIRCLAPAVLIWCWSVTAAGNLFAAEGKSKPRVPLIVDTAFGSGVEGAFALAGVEASQAFEIVGLATGGDQAEDRAWMVCRWLTNLGQSSPVAFGRDPQPAGKIDWQIQYRRHPAAVWNRTQKPDKTPADAAMARWLIAREGKTTLLVVGPLTNLARALEAEPRVKEKIARVVWSPGRDLPFDAAAAKVVLRSGLRIEAVLPEERGGLEWTEQELSDLFAAQTQLTLELENLVQLWQTRAELPHVFAPLAIRIAAAESPEGLVSVKVAVGGDGLKRSEAGEFSVWTPEKIDRSAAARQTLAMLRGHGNAVPPRLDGPRSSVVDRGGLPKLVHAFEDYETPIERRWWMCGKVNDDPGPAAGSKACRSVLTQDFDDLLGDRASRYGAVIFNPVPGPPMGKNTRLFFRYHLSGSDAIRVQLYSLSNGYHRQTTISGLPQGSWQEATVDMTQMRRPNGEGGPLSADERIDDIQFYVSPRARLLIDEMILYEAAPPEEKRPFPHRVLFTAWFDTGKQGVEWPGDFAIAEHEKPRTWKYAQSIANKEGAPWIRLSLRGDRTLARQIAIRCSVRMSRASSLVVKLVNTKSGESASATLSGITPGEWSDATATFDLGERFDKFKVASELHFTPAEPAAFGIDDLLLYEP